MRRTLLRRTVALLACLLVGCKAKPTGVASHRLAPFFGQILHAAYPDSRVPPPTNVVVVTSNICLQCRNVGWLVRKLNLQPGEAVGVVTGVEDVAAVKRYLEREKVDAAVVGIQSALLKNAVFRDSLVWLRRAPADANVVAHVAYDAVHAAPTLVTK